VVSVGLTGGLGAGKSSALQAFHELGAVTFSADAVVHELYRRPEIMAALAGRFGPQVLGPHGEVDRERLGSLVAGDDGARAWLEQLVHPRVGEQLDSLRRSAPPGSVVVCEVPLLFESGLQDRFDLVVTIEAPRALRVERVGPRMPAALFGRFDALQLTSEQRMAASDLAYPNEHDLTGLRGFVAEVYRRARALLDSLPDRPPVAR